MRSMSTAAFYDREETTIDHCFRGRYLYERNGVQLLVLGMTTRGTENYAVDEMPMRSYFRIIFMTSAHEVVVLYRDCRQRAVRQENMRRCNTNQTTEGKSRATLRDQ